MPGKRKRSDSHKTCSGKLHNGDPCRRRVHRRGLCWAHLYPCKAPDCDNQAILPTDYCVCHGGGVRCAWVDEQTGKKCGKSARGSTEYCANHGGGPRCGWVDEQTGETCGNGAISPTDYCKNHGGGVRCVWVDEQTGDKCGTSARSSTEYCVNHGGGPRCAWVDEQTGKKCGKSARSSTEYCANHGGGPRCGWVDEQIGKKCGKIAQGSTEYCVNHGGGLRCEAECCTPFPESERSLAKYRHPETGIRICTFQARFCVIEAQFVEVNMEKHHALMEYFGFKTEKANRAEHVFYHMLVKQVPELTQMIRALDQSIASAMEGKAKRVSDLRPDYIHYYPATNMACYGEFDEDDDHEDDEDRLRRITGQVVCGYERTYIFRVRAHIYNRAKALFVRKVSQQHYAYFTPTERGKQVVQDVANHVRECLALMKQGIPPTSGNNKVVFE